MRVFAWKAVGDGDRWLAQTEREYSLWSHGEWRSWEEIERLVKKSSLGEVETGHVREACKAEFYIRFFPLPSSLRGESLQLHSTFLRFVLHGKKAALELHSFARETGGPRAHRLFPPPHAVIFAAAQDDRTGRCQHGDYCAPRRGASGGIFCERSGLHLAGQLPAVDNCRSSSVGYRRQDELT